MAKVAQQGMTEMNQKMEKSLGEMNQKVEALEKVAKALQSRIVTLESRL